MRNISFKCQNCGKDFIDRSACKTRLPKYCSRDCYGESLIGHKLNKNQLKALEKGRYKGKKIGGWHWSEVAKQKASEQRKGKKLPDYHRKALSKAKKGKPIKHLIEKREEIAKKISKALLGKPQPWQRGANHWNWQGGIVELNYQIRNSLKYKNWRRAIFKNDNFTCQICGERGGRLQADHQKKFAQILFENNITSLEGAFNCRELWNINNGRTLCKQCH